VAAPTLTTLHPPYLLRGLNSEEGAKGRVKKKNPPPLKTRLEHSPSLRCLIQSPNAFISAEGGLAPRGGNKIGKRPIWGGRESEGWWGACWWCWHSSGKAYPDVWYGSFVGYRCTRVGEPIRGRDRIGQTAVDTHSANKGSWSVGGISSLLQSPAQLHIRSDHSLGMLTGQPRYPRTSGITERGAGAEPVLTEIKSFESRE